MLSGAARTMLSSLSEKEALERQMVASERLAAVGRVAAAIAHEINNPLGGMLNSVDTLEKHGQPDGSLRSDWGSCAAGCSRSAPPSVLCSSRRGSTLPILSAQDWEDLRTLIEPQVERADVDLRWEIALPDHVPLPAHQVRQLVLNLIAQCRQGGSASDGRFAWSRSLSIGALVVKVGNSARHSRPSSWRTCSNPSPSRPNVTDGALRARALGLLPDRRTNSGVRSTATSDATGPSLSRRFLFVLRRRGYEWPYLPD